MGYIYFGTVTFDSDFLIEQKNELIGNFTKVLSQHLSHRTTEYYIQVSKEYHKTDGEDDYERPHIHYLLHSSKKLPKYRVQAIRAYFNQTHGLSQFFLCTTKQSEHYNRYIQKDVKQNDEATGESHYFEMNLEETMEDYDLNNIVEDYDDDL